MASTMSEYSARKQILLDKLGGKCISCGSTYDLQFDHVDHNNKSFTIMTNWALSMSTLDIELEKCQLLCKTCHKVKTSLEGSQCKSWTTKTRPQVHGTVWSYTKFKCRCDDCKAAKSKYEKELRDKKQNVAQSGQSNPFGADRSQVQILSF